MSTNDLALNCIHGQPPHLPCAACGRGYGNVEWWAERVENQTKRLAQLEASVADLKKDRDRWKKHAEEMEARLKSLYHAALNADVLHRVLGGDSS